MYCLLPSYPHLHSPVVDVPSTTQTASSPVKDALTTAQVPSSPVVDVPYNAQSASSPVLDAFSTSQLHSSPVVDVPSTAQSPSNKATKADVFQDINLHYYYPIHIGKDVMDLSYLRQKHQISQFRPLQVRPLHLNGMVAIRLRLLRRHQIF